MEKYRDMALELGAEHAKLINPGYIYFDKRSLLKCRWGCDFDGKRERQRCGPRGISLKDAQEAIRSYERVLVVHSFDAHPLTRILLKIESQAFLDGHYWSFVLRACNYCKTCTAETEKGCLFPQKIRPCEQTYGIDVYKTVRELGLPCQPLQDKADRQNRYGFVLLG